MKLMKLIFLTVALVNFSMAAEAGRTLRTQATSISVVASSNLISTMKPGQWLEVSNSKMASVVYNGPLANELFAQEGPAGIMDDWSGGVFDSDTTSLLVWGGGHKGYYGNEIYGFNLNTLKWSMRSQPSSVAGWDRVSTVLPATANQPEGTPASAHGRGSMVYLPGQGFMIVSAEGAADSGSGTVSGWLYQTSSSKWVKRAKCPGGYYGFSATDIDPLSPSFGRVFALGQAIGGAATLGLQDYEPNTDIWKTRGSDGLPSYAMMGAVDGVDNLVVAIGGGFIRSTPITGASSGFISTPKTTGDKSAELANAPGFVWYPPGKVFVAWTGGTNIFTLDPKTWVWTKRNLSPENTVNPTAANSRGTYGRFQYDSFNKVFVVVNSINENVFIYKPNF